MRRFSLSVLVASCLFLVRSAAGAEGAAATMRMVSIEIVIAEFHHASKPDEVGKYEVVENVTERLKQLERQGQIGAVGRMQLTTLDGFPTSVQIGERMPVLTGRTRVQGGFPGDRGGASPMAASYSFQNFGTMVSVTPTIEADGAVVLALEVERTRLVPVTPSAGGNAPNDELQSRTATVTSKTTISVANGQTVLVSGAKTVDKEQTGELLIMASARVSSAAPAKEGAAAPSK